jgi:hypothetical protein
MTTGNKLHDPERKAGIQAEAREARRELYKGMTAAEIIRHMPDVELDRNARRGAPMAIFEQAYRHNMQEAWNTNNTERSDFERTVMVEGGI